MGGGGAGAGVGQVGTFVTGHQMLTHASMSYGK